MNKAQHEQHEKRNGGNFSELVSDFLFRWRKMILISALAFIIVVVAWSMYLATASQRSQTTALSVYELRKVFQEWKDAHPESLLTAEKILEGSDEQLDLDEETEHKREETQKALTELVEKGVNASQKNIQAWAYWIQAQKFRYLKENSNFQATLEKLMALEDKTFYKIATLQLAGLLYSEGKTDEAVAKWRELSDVSGPEPEQVIASIYLGNYFARNDQKEEAIRYWQQVESLEDELLHSNDLTDGNSLLSGDNLIVGNFRNTLAQWKAVAENQLLFLQSDKIEIAADSYDETMEPKEEAPEEKAPTEIETDSQTVSFTTNAKGNIPQNIGNGIVNLESLLGTEEGTSQ